MLREYVKWDYELRTPAQLEAVIDRAMELMHTEPRGPVYLTLPREVLAAPPGAMTITSPSRRQSKSERFPDPARIDEAARILARADRPSRRRSVLLAVSDAQLPVRRSHCGDTGRRASAAGGGRAPACRRAGRRASPRARCRRAPQAPGGVGRDGAEADGRIDDRVRVGIT